MAFPGVADAIINGYNVVLPYVNYGVDLAQYAVGWIPVAGIFAPQIGIFYYNLIQPIVTSAVYNTAYVIGGNIGFIQAVSNVINDSINAGIGFVNAQINWALSFLPPLPPLPLAATQATTLKTALVAAEPAGEPVTESAAAGKPDTTVAASVEATSKEAPVAEKAPMPADPASTETVKGEPAAVQEPVTTKPETEPVARVDDYDLVVGRRRGAGRGARWHHQRRGPQGRGGIEGRSTVGSEARQAGRQARRQACGEASRIRRGC